MRVRRLLAAVAIAAVAVPLAASAAAAHAERESTFPDGTGATPQYRFDGPTLVVCKPDTARRLDVLPAALRLRNAALLEDCAFEHIQDAIDAVTEQGTRILVLPGIYREEPSHAPLSAECAELANPGGEVDEEGNPVGAPVLSYEQQQACPHIQNLIAIFGDSADEDQKCDLAVCDLQIEGTGASPLDVVVDGDYSKLNGVRADRADGLYLRNFTVQRFEFNAVYALETDGVAFDDVVVRWNDEYGFLSFAVDHGLYHNCEGYGNGDGGVYPGSASDINPDAGFIDETEGIRFATEIRGCRSHHNGLGYSGTAGNSVETHHTEFDHNAVGYVTDSLVPNHPGMPQDHSYVHDNLFHSNNVNYYRFAQDGESCTGPFEGRDYDEGVVCPVFPVPVGTGILLAGGNHNLFERNRIYDNWRQGAFQFFVPAALREEPDPTLQFDTSNFNTWRDNVVGVNPNGAPQPNVFDFVWDGEGEGNCWDANVGPDGAAPSTGIGDGNPEDTLPAPLPGCASRPPFTPGPAIIASAGCATYDRNDDPAPAGCRWLTTPAPPAERQPANPTLERLAGGDRVATSVLVSREAYPYGAEAVVIARADDFADALAGAPLAAHVEGPLLITGSDGLDAAVAEEIARLGATRALLLGGTTALSAQVESDLAAAGVRDVVRVAGEDRAATAVRIAELIGSGNAFLVNATAFADALSAASLGALLTRPLLLTGPDELPAATREFLAGPQVVDVRLVGGTAVISDAVMESLQAINPAIIDVERTAGGNRYETSAQLAQLAVQAGSDETELWLATGANWPDALGAAAASAVDEGVLLLVDPSTMDDAAPAAAYFEATAPVLENVRILGGTAAVSQAVEDAVVERTGAVAGDARGDRSTGVLVHAGDFSLLPTAPAGYAGVTGRATMRRTLHGTTEVEVLVSGMPAGATAPAHVHAQTCAEDAGGPHFTFDPAGPATPPNEIHPAFVADAAGVGRGTDTAFAVAPAGARSVVIHAPDGTKVACADLAGPAVPAGIATQPTEATVMTAGTSPTGPPQAAGLAVLAAAGLAAVWLRRRQVARLAVAAMR